MTDPSPPQSGGPPPGWYDDPWAPGRWRRWWNGTEWTAQLAAPQPAAPAQPAAASAPEQQAAQPAAPFHQPAQPDASSAAEHRPAWPWLMGGAASAVVVAGAIGFVIAANAGVFEDDGGGAEDTGKVNPPAPTTTVPSIPRDSEPYSSPRSHRIPEVGRGRTVSMRTQDGTPIRVTVLGKVDPVPRGSYSLRPPRGTRWVGVRMRLENPGPDRFSDAPANGAKLLSRGREFRAVSASPGGCPDFEAIVKLGRGEAAAGCLIFEVDRRSKRVDRLQFSPSSGYSPDVATWRLSG